MPKHLRRIALALAVSFAISSMHVDLSPTPAFAAEEEEPEVTCAWCGWMFFESGPMHVFFTGTDLCGFPKPTTAYSVVECSRCGGTSACHTVASPGECHMACGGENLQRVVASLTRATELGDLAAVLNVLRTKHEGLSVDFSREGGRFRVIADCDRSVAAATIPVSPELTEVVAAQWSE